MDISGRLYEVEVNIPQWERRLNERYIKRGSQC